MNATDLLRELETLAHAARVRRMVALGQAARSDSRSAGVIAALEQGDVYARSLALYTCYGSGDGAYIAGAASGRWARVGRAHSRAASAGGR